MRSAGTITNESSLLENPMHSPILLEATYRKKSALLRLDLTDDITFIQTRDFFLRTAIRIILVLCALRTEWRRNKAKQNFTTWTLTRLRRTKLTCITNNYITKYNERDEKNVMIGLIPRSETINRKRKLFHFIFQRKNLQKANNLAYRYLRVTLTSNTVFFLYHLHFKPSLYWVSPISFKIVFAVLSTFQADDAFVQLFELSFSLLPSLVRLWKSNFSGGSLLASSE